MKPKVKFNYRLRDRNGIYHVVVYWINPITKEQEKLKVEAENKVKLAEYALREKELQAKANEIESNSLSPQLLKKMAIEKWNGVLPKVQSPNNNNLISIDN